MKIGPLCVRNSLVLWSRISEPRMSEGSRSTVNWIRANAEVDRLREDGHEERLGQAGDTLEQEVAAGEEGDQVPLDDHVLADDDACRPARGRPG